MQEGREVAEYGVRGRSEVFSCTVFYASFRDGFRSELEQDCGGEEVGGEGDAGENEECCCELWRVL